MEFFYNFLYKIKPGIPRENLFLLGGIVWLFAGFMLAMKGTIFILGQGHHKIAEVLIASMTGVLFYLLLFIRISRKHILRIKSNKEVKPCLFSFFDFKGYLLICIMISAGITLRHINKKYWDYLYTFYIGMGIPLLISSMNFFNTWIKETNIREKIDIEGSSELF